MMKSDAYRLADDIEVCGKDLIALNMKGGTHIIQAAAMLRKLADENEALHILVGGQFHLTVYTTPTTVIEQPE